MDPMGDGNQNRNPAAPKYEDSSILVWSWLRLPIVIAGPAHLSENGFLRIIFTCDDKKYCGNSPCLAEGLVTLMRGFWYIKILQEWKDIFPARMFMWYVYQVLKPPLLKSIEIKELTAQNLQCPTLKSSSIAFFIYFYIMYSYSNQCVCLSGRWFQSPARYSHLGSWSMVEWHVVQHLSILETTNLLW